MSHELRTPLNSILVLGQQLGDNPDGNLTAKQVEFARTIHGAGTDLLNLISDILDLSKIESGTVSVEAEEVFFASLLDMVARPFRHEAENRQLTFEVQADPQSRPQPGHRLQAPAAGAQEPALQRLQIHRARRRAPLRLACRQRLEQRPSRSSAVPARSSPSRSPTPASAFPPEKQTIIFEAFQQADAGTSRKYGGTGLGLAISRELASLLGGEIQLRSTPGAGSTFTLYLPQTYVGPCDAAWIRGTAGTSPPLPPTRSAGRPLWLRTDRANRSPTTATILQPGDAILLIVEDDPHYARILCDLSRDKGFKVLVAMRGAEALALAREFHPDGRLARRLPARHARLDRAEPSEAGPGDAPYSGADADPGRRPAARPLARRLRLCHQADHERGSGRGASLASRQYAAAAPQAAAGRRRQSGRAAQHPRAARLRRHRRSPSPTPARRLWPHCTSSRYDCVVLDLRLPDMSGFEVLEQLRDDPLQRPAGGRLHRQRISRRRRMRACTCWPAASSSRAWSRPSGCSTKPRCSCTASSPTCRREKQNMLDRLHRSDEALVGKKVLVVDDDVRNIFALSSVLERRGMDGADGRNRPRGHRHRSNRRPTWPSS